MPICAHSLTGNLLQWSNNLICTPTSLVEVRSNHCCQIGSISENRPQNISWGSQIISIITIVLLQMNQLLCYRSSWSVNQAQRSSNCLAACSYFVPPKESTPGERHFSPLKFIKESFLRKNMCLHMTNGRRSDHWSCILSSHATDSNLEHPTFSAELFFSLITLCSWIILRKKSVHPLSQIMLEIVY